MPFPPFPEPYVPLGLSPSHPRPLPRPPVHGSSVNTCKFVVNTRREGPRSRRPPYLALTFQPSRPYISPFPPLVHGDRRSRPSRTRRHPHLQAPTPATHKKHVKIKRIGTPLSGHPPLLHTQYSPFSPLFHAFSDLAKRLQEVTPIPHPPALAAPCHGTPYPRKNLKTRVNTRHYRDTLRVARYSEVGFRCFL